MKSITLSKSQSEKLLEMCRKLFPEYSWGFENDNADLGVMEYYTHQNDWKFIHWFEFCMTFLVNDIAFKSTTSDILADAQYEENRLRMINDMFQDRIDPSLWHPVDYLYNEFKKLKL